MANIPESRGYAISLAALSSLSLVPHAGSLQRGSHSVLGAHYGR